MKTNLQAELTRIGELNAKKDGLLRCPFCSNDSRAALRVVDDEYGDWVECKRCGAHGPFNSKREYPHVRPIEFDWNTRLAPTLFACFEQAMAVNAKLITALERIIENTSDVGSKEVAQFYLAYAEANGCGVKGEA